jgi:hypothetical protein
MGRSAKTGTVLNGAPEPWGRISTARRARSYDTELLGMQSATMDPAGGP